VKRETEGKSTRMMEHGVGLHDPPRTSLTIPEQQMRLLLLDRCDFSSSAVLFGSQIGFSEIHNNKIRFKQQPCGNVVEEDKSISYPIHFPTMILYGG
jgi:hypothetical protein